MLYECASKIGNDIANIGQESTSLSTSLTKDCYIQLSVKYVDIDWGRKIWRKWLKEESFVLFNLAWPVVSVYKQMINCNACTAIYTAILCYVATVILLAIATVASFLTSHHDYSYIAMPYVCMSSYTYSYIVIHIATYNYVAN